TPAATVPPNQKAVQLVGSESSDPGDSGGTVNLMATIASPGLPTRSATANGTGRAVLTLPLLGSGVGRTYTIRWSAVFDSGGHPCPGTTFPTTTAGTPFTVRVTNSRSS